MKPVIILCLALPALPQSLTAKTKENTLTDAQLQAYSDVQKKLYPDKGDLYQKARNAFPNQQEYLFDQILALEKPKTTKAYNYDSIKAEDRTKVKMPKFAIDRSTAKQALEIHRARNPHADDPWAALLSKFGDKPWYYSREIRDAEEKGKKLAEYEAKREKNDPVGKYAAQINAKEKETVFKGLLIRESWSDVLAKEDRTQPDSQKKTLDDLVGAKLSYAHDGRAHADTWSAKGALIMPFEWDFAPSSAQRLRHLALAPSVSIDKVDTNGDASGRTDSLFFRLGLYADFNLYTHYGTTTDPRVPSENTYFNIKVRAAGVYATDTAFGARLPGFEIDVEPQVQAKGFLLGYKKAWTSKPSLELGKKDTSLFDTQLRAWLHMEGGNLQDNSGSWDQAKGSFFRIGPTAQFQLRFPQLIWGNDLSFTARGSYYGSTSGSHASPYFYSLSLVYDLYKSTETGRKVSINAGYDNGGLSFTKEKEDKFTISLGVLF